VEPVGAAPLTLIYLHGGGYYSCSPETHRPVTAGFAARGFRVFAPAYRLAPEHPFPAALEDALGVYRGLRADTPPRTIVMSGESAGGGLTLALLASIRDAGEQPPAAAALFSPWTDLALTGDSARANGRRCACWKQVPSQLRQPGTWAAPTRGIRLPRLCTRTRPAFLRY
jgi:acetyl esterase/lipase